MNYFSGKFYFSHWVNLVDHRDQASSGFTQQLMFSEAIKLSLKIVINAQKLQSAPPTVLHRNMGLKIADDSGWGGVSVVPYWVIYRLIFCI